MGTTNAAGILRVVRRKPIGATSGRWAHGPGRRSLTSRRPCRSRSTRRRRPRQAPVRCPLPGAGPCRRRTRGRRRCGGRRVAGSDAGFPQSTGASAGPRRCSRRPRSGAARRTWWIEIGFCGPSSSTARSVPLSSSGPASPIWNVTAPVLPMIRCGGTPNTSGAHARMKSAPPPEKIQHSKPLASNRLEQLDHRLVHHRRVGTSEAWVASCRDPGANRGVELVGGDRSVGELEEFEHRRDSARLSARRAWWACRAGPHGRGRTPVACTGSRSTGFRRCRRPPDAIRLRYENGRSRDR